MRKEGLSMAEEIEWFVGIDWASQSQQVLPGRCPRRVLGRASRCAWRPGDRGAVRLANCPHRRHARGHWGGHRNDLGPGRRSLLGTRFCVYGINPKQLDRFRDRFTVAGAKDDRRDAHLLGDSLHTDRHAFRRAKERH